MTSKIALLIDAENISYKDLPRVLEEVPRHGEIVLQAVYGNWQTPALQKWLEIAEKNSFIIRHQTNTSRTKNSSDMKLIMDAMEVLFRTPVDTFCLVSNDADYVPLCDKIHESRKYVIGVGSPRAAEAFIRACDVFIFIGRGELPVQPSLQSLIAPTVKVPAASQTPALPGASNPIGLQKLLTDAYARLPQGATTWTTMPLLAAEIVQLQPGFHPNQYGQATLTKLLQSMPGFVELQLQNGVAVARLKNGSAPIPAEKQKIRELLSKAFTKTPRDANQWSSLTAIGQVLHELQPDFRTNHYGHATLKKLLKSMPDFVELRADSGGTSARLKP